MPAVEVLGVIAPVVVFIESPTVELKVPPVYKPVPVTDTACPTEIDLQNGLLE